MSGKVSKGGRGAIAYSLNIYCSFLVLLLFVSRRDCPKFICKIKLYGRLHSEFTFSFFIYLANYSLVP